MKPDKVFLLTNFYVFSKTLIKMAKLDLKFLEGNGSYISVKKTDYDPDEEWENGIAPKNEIFISGYDEDEKVYFAIQLDKSTAIKFAKTLRTEINKIEG